MTWLKDGPNAIISDDGWWRITKRYRQGIPEYALFRAEKRNGCVWRFKQHGKSVEELKVVVEEQVA
jgi:hypothetical protein